MAATPTPPPVLRVRLAGPDELRARAEWALEALLARARVLDWAIVDERDTATADLAWGDDRATVVLPADASQWEFAWDHEPDSARDPLAFTFWWLARVEEQLAPPDAFDEHGRFRSDCSALARRDDPLFAPVDELVLPLGVPRIEPLAYSLADFVAEPDPDAPAWRLVLTHDIDLPARWTHAGRRRALRSIVADLRRGRLGSAIRTKLAFLAGLVPGRRDPWDNFERITALEHALDAESTSYLLVGRHVPEDGSAELHEHGRSWFGAVRGAQLGDHVGLHGSYTASDTPGRLAAELAELGARTRGSHPDHRFHYLRHRPVDAWPLLARTGIRSDSSLGYAERPGFRAGTAHPYRAWDHATGQPLDLVVIPLVVMDASFDARYLDVRSRGERQRRIIELVDTIAWYDGAASLLVHNDRLCNFDDDGWTRAYRRILRHVRQSGGRGCTAAEAAAAYLARLPEHRRTTRR